MRQVLAHVHRLRAGAAVQDQHPLPGLPAASHRRTGQTALPEMRPRRVHSFIDGMVRAVLDAGRRPETAASVRAVRGDGASAEQRVVWSLLATPS